jgi:hypothetical protein
MHNYHCCGTDGHRLVKRLTTPFAYPAFGAILVQLIANLGWSAAITTKQRHIGNVDGRFDLNDTSLGTCTTGGPLMLLHHIDTRDNHPVFVRILAYSVTLAICLPTADNPVDGAFCSTLVTAQDYDGITFPYLHRYLLTYDSTLITIASQPNNGERQGERNKRTIGT